MKITLTNQGVKEILQKHFIEMYEFDEVVVELVPYDECQKISAEITINTNGTNTKSEGASS